MAIQLFDKKKAKPDQVKQGRSEQFLARLGNVLNMLKPGAVLMHIEATSTAPQPANPDAFYTWPGDEQDEGFNRVQQGWPTRTFQEYVPVGQFATPLGFLLGAYVAPVPVNLCWDESTRIFTTLAVAVPGTVSASYRGARVTPSTGWMYSTDGGKLFNAYTTTYTATVNGQVGRAYVPKIQANEDCYKLGLANYTANKIYNVLLDAYFTDVNGADRGVQAVAYHYLCGGSHSSTDYSDFHSFSLYTHTWTNHGTMYSYPSEGSGSFSPCGNTSYTGYRSGYCCGGSRDSTADFYSTHRCIPFALNVAAAAASMPATRKLHYDVGGATGHTVIGGANGSGNYNTVWTFAAQANAWMTQTSLSGIAYALAGQSITLGAARF